MVSMAQKGYIVPENMAGRGDPVPENMAGGEDPVPENSSREGDPVHENMAGRGDPVPENMAGGGHPVPENSSREGDPVPASSSREGDPVPASSSREGDPVPESSTREGDPVPENSSREGDPVPESSTREGDPVPENSSREGDPVPENSSREGDPVPESSIREGDPVPENSTREGDPVPESSIREGDPVPENSTREGDPVPESSIREGDPVPENSTREGDPVPESSIREGDPVPENSTREGDPVPESSIREGDPVPENSSREGDPVPESSIREGDPVPENSTREGDPVPERMSLGGDSVPERMSLGGDSVPERMSLGGDSVPDASVQDEDPISESRVQQGACVLLTSHRMCRAFRIRKGKKVLFGRHPVLLDFLLGQPYGSRFEVDRNGKLHLVMSAPVPTQDALAAGSGLDNRNIVDDCSSQKLSTDDIRNLKEQGFQGKEIVQQLVRNSSTFQDKTEFSQNKYIKKKKEKYELTLTVHKPTCRLIAEMYYARNPSKICNLRCDSLAQLLLFANVRAGSKLLACDDCSGLLLAAVLERMGGHGWLLNIYHGANPNHTAISLFDFPSSVLNSLLSFPLARLGSLIEGFAAGKDHIEPSGTVAEDTVSGRTRAVEEDCETLNACEGRGSSLEETAMEGLSETCYEAKPIAVGKEIQQQSETNEENVIFKDAHQSNRLERMDTCKKMLLQRDADGLIMATCLHPWPVLEALLEFVAPSRPFAVHCQYKEPLVECYQRLKERGGTVGLRLTESWLRFYQVLPKRTHPIMNASGSGGFLLCGFTVERSSTAICQQRLSMKKYTGQRKHHREEGSSSSVTEPLIKKSRVD